MSDHRIVQIENLAALKTLAEKLIAVSGEKMLFLLDGPMGSGKTQLTKYMLEAVGSDEAVSPSFAIHNAYETAHGEVHHFDLFRLESVDDLESTGFWDLFATDAWVVIEWADKLRDLGLFDQLPAGWPRVSLNFSSDPQTLTRKIDVRFTPPVSFL